MYMHTCTLIHVPLSKHESSRVRALCSTKAELFCGAPWSRFLNGVVGSEHGIA